jgi:hypothetical protein
MNFEARKLYCSTKCPPQNTKRLLLTSPNKQNPVKFIKHMHVFVFFTFFYCTNSSKSILKPLMFITIKYDTIWCAVLYFLFRSASWSTGHSSDYWPWGPAFDSRLDPEDYCLKGKIPMVTMVWIVWLNLAAPGTSYSRITIHLIGTT